jgi:isoleucyl-tRNA synthetase
MKGQRAERRFGWDCHGLPAEVETERQIGVSGRQAITDYGIGRFNDAPGERAPVHRRVAAL